MPVGDIHVTGFDDILLTHELGAKQWLRDNDSAAYMAIDEWEGDLAWLKKKYYNGKFDSSWPRT